LSSLRRLLLRLFEAIAPRAGVAIQLALDRRPINAKLARYGGLREPALHEGVNLATFFVGQMVIACGHMSSVRCGVPREDSLHLAVRDPACTTWKSVAGEQDGLKGARYARIAAGNLRPCPRPFPQPLCSAMSSMHRCCTSELKRRSDFRSVNQINLRLRCSNLFRLKWVVKHASRYTQANVKDLDADNRHRRHS